jgi:hypothetical protein
LPTRFGRSPRQMAEGPQGCVKPAAADVKSS